MRIEFETEGGLAYFPGLSKPVVVDSGELPAAQAAELERLVAAADFFALPPEVGAQAPGAADYVQYTITAEDGGRRHRVRVTDPVRDPTLGALLNALKGAAKAQRARPTG